MFERALLTKLEFCKLLSKSFARSWSKWKVVARRTSYTILHVRQSTFKADRKRKIPEHKKKSGTIEKELFTLTSSAHWNMKPSQTYSTFIVQFPIPDLWNPIAKHIWKLPVYSFHNSFLVRRVSMASHFNRSNENKTCLCNVIRYRFTRALREWPHFLENKILYFGAKIMKCVESNYVKLCIN